MARPQPENNPPQRRRRDDRLKIYLRLPDDRLEGYPILIRMESDPAEVFRAVDTIISSIDPDLLGNAFTLEDALRRSPPFIVSNDARRPHVVVIHKYYARSRQGLHAAVPEECEYSMLPHAAR